MTARPQPNNATPQRLRLAPQNVPRMPFSSPMGEEVLSPTSPNASQSPPQHQIKLSQNRSRPDDSAEDRWIAPSQKHTSSKHEQSEEKGGGKSRWPSLNVVTDLARPPASRQNAMGGGVKQNAGLGLKKKQSGGITTSRKASIETLGLGHQPSGNSLRTFGSKGRLGDLKRASSKWSNLSPSDRAVVIGISVSPEELANQSPSSERDSGGKEGLSEQHAVDRSSSVMPTIVITPAKEKAPWSDDHEDMAPMQQQRAASNIYSQLTSHRDPRIKHSATIPPIPPLPPDVPNQAGNNKRYQPPPRIVSAYTEIDDGESPDLRDEEKPDTGKSQLRILTKRSSLDTIATKHRSQGWWNHIISPFFSKSPMTFKSPTPPQELVPGTPSGLEQGKSLQAARQSFPPPPESDGLRSGHTSWTDSNLDADYEKRLELGGLRDRSTMISDTPQETLVRDSSLIPLKFEGFGAAAEYYEAYLYDMHSETPYFECQNHVCLPSKVSPKDFVGSGNANPQGIEEEKTILEIPHQGQKAGLPLAAQQAPSNRFSAAFNEAVNPGLRHRPQSDATMIDDLETTPDVQEALAAPVVRAPAPVPAAQPPLPKSAESDSSNDTEEPSSTPPPQITPAEFRRFSPAAPVNSPSPNPTPASPPPRQERTPKKYVAVLPPEPRSHMTFELPLSPEPVSPGQQNRGPIGAIPLEEVKTNYDESHPTSNPSGLKKASQNPRLRQPITSPPDTPPKSKQGLPQFGSKPVPTSRTVLDNGNARYDGNPDREQTTVADLYPPPKYQLRSQSPQGLKEGKTTVRDLYPPPKDVSVFEKKRDLAENNVLPAREPKENRNFTFPKCRNCFGSSMPGDNKNKKIVIAVATGLTLLVVLILVLVMTLTLTKRGHKMPVQAGWLNLTNFPPIPTGVSTIVQPTVVDEDTSCISPQTMWSCALPEEEHQGVLPNAPNQPNFRIEIMFQNGTNATANTAAGNSSNSNKRSYGHVANAVSARTFLRHKMLYSRNSFNSDQYDASPAPPNLEDQTFLGNTTDGNVMPFDGEFTPFFMSFESATKLSSRSLKRQRSSPDNNTDFPDPTKAIPPPDTNLDGTAAAADLYPFPSSQPLRLYDRGLDTEHYGFYTYYDRSIFLKSAAPLDDPSSNNTGPVPDDENGGADEKAALLRCTWAQTRFLVQIWTKKGDSAALLTSSNTTSKPTHHSFGNSTNLSSSSANDFTCPGSFPYPITIKLDRHGGDIKKKMVYCYKLDEREHYNTTVKQFQIEDRGVGGQLINPALGPFGDVNVTTAQGGPGGIDGGSGGCACKWQNFGTGL